MDLFYLCCKVKKKLQWTDGVIAAHFASISDGHCSDVVRSVPHWPVTTSNSDVTVCWHTKEYIFTLLQQSVPLNHWGSAKAWVTGGGNYSYILFNLFQGQLRAPQLKTFLQNKLNWRSNSLTILVFLHINRKNQRKQGVCLWHCNSCLCNELICIM